MFRILKIAVFICCLALAGSSPVAAADVVLNMTGRITLDCLVNSGLGLRFRYDHAPNQLCHLAEATASGPLLNLSWPTPLCKESPDDKRCLEWSAGGCCVWCGARSGQHTQEETRGTSLAPGSYTEAVSAAPFVAGGAAVTGFFAFNWTQSGDINDTRVCAGDSAGFSLNPGETWSVALIVPDLGQTTRLEKVDGDGQKTLLGGTLAVPLGVKASGVDNVGSASLKGGLAIAWTVTDPGGAVVSQFGSVTDTQTGISTVTVSLGGTPGVYTITANCAACAANQQVTFTGTALTQKQATELSTFDCDGSGFLSDSLPGGIRVRAINSVTGKPAPGFQVQFLLLSSPGGTGISLTPGPVSTDGNGIAHAGLTFGDIPGEYNVIATCQDCEGNQQATCRPSAIPKPDLPALATYVPVQRLKKGISVSMSPPSVSPQQTDGNHIANISIQGMPQMGFTATVSAIPFTGGHQHGGAGRPLGTLSAQSSFTDESGNAMLAYTAGEVGGLEMISIQTDDGAQADAVVTVTVDPALNRLPASPNYITNSGDGTHPNFLYGTSSLISAIDFMANHYTTDYTTGTSIISINDMSLINGGLFDVRGTWATVPWGHVSHRKGIDVDVNSDAVSRANGRAVPDPQLKNRLDAIIQRFDPNCIRVPEEPIHYRCP